MVVRTAQGLLVLVCAVAGLLLAAELRLGASQQPCRDVVQLPGVAAACVLEQAPWWGLALGAAAGALVAAVALMAWRRSRR